MEEIIKTESLTKIYKPYSVNKKVALKDVSMTVYQGSFVSIMGRSGSGKTTLINVLSTIDEATQGHVYILGKDTLTLSEKEKAQFRRENLSLIFQDFNLIDSLTIKDNILFSLRLNQKKPKDYQEKLETIIKELEIEDILDKYPFECSGGQNQRVAIARALITDPQILFCDEPTGNLDSILSKQLMSLFCKINQEYHITIVMVTHDSLVAAYSSEMYYVEDGQITQHLQRGKESFEDYYSKIAKISMKIDL